MSRYWTTGAGSVVFADKTLLDGTGVLPLVPPSRSWHGDRPEAPAPDQPKDAPGSGLATLHHASDRSVRGTCQCSPRYPSSIRYMLGTSTHEVIHQLHHFDYQHCPNHTHSKANPSYKPLSWTSPAATWRFRAFHWPLPKRVYPSHPTLKTLSWICLTRCYDGKVVIASIYCQTSSDRSVQVTEEISGTTTEVVTVCD